MAKNVIVKPLGLVLRKAGLVSSEQVEKALKESLVLPKYKLGEILAIRGWIKPETADFFAETWPFILTANSNNSPELIDRLIPTTLYSPQTYQVVTSGTLTPQLRDRLFSQDISSPKSLSSKTGKKQLPIQPLEPLGQYLKAASLIDDRQISQILKIQQNNTDKFGKIAVEQNIISQQTLEFFLEHLNLIKTGEKINLYPDSVALELDRLENYILQNPRCEPVKLLQKYEKIRQQGTIVASGDIAEQELLASGIVVLNDNMIRIAKPTYLANFNEEWLEKELANLQPYNQIRLKMFDLDNKAVIPYKLLNAVNSWTDRHPFLSQKLYQLIQEKLNYIPPGQEEIIIEELTYKYIIDDWQDGVAAKHFQTISDRIINNECCNNYSLLKTYKKIWQLQEINANKSLEQQELLRIGLIKLQNQRVSPSNRIYQAVFDRQWIEERLDSIESDRASVNNKLSKTKISINYSSNSETRKSKYILPIIGIISFLLALPFAIKLINQSAPNKELNERSDSILQNQQ